MSHDAVEPIDWLEDAIAEGYDVVASTVMVRPVELVAGDRLLVGSEWRTCVSKPWPTIEGGRVRLRVALDHRGSHSWPMDHASRFASVEIRARAEHGPRRLVAG